MQRQNTGESTQHSLIHVTKNKLHLLGVHLVAVKKPLMSSVKVKLDVKESVQPVFCPKRSVAYEMRNAAPQQVVDSSDTTKI